MPLSEEQALDLLRQSYSWKERLQRAYRLGLLRGAEIADDLWTRAGTADEAADAILREAEEE